MNMACGQLGCRAFAHTTTTSLPAARAQINPCRGQFCRQRHKVAPFANTLCAPTACWLAVCEQAGLPTYDMFRGKCYELATKKLGVEIPLTSVTVKAYNDYFMCPKGSVKPGQLI